MITKYLIEEQTLTDIANSIRTMEGSSDTILVEEYASRISKIEPSTEEYMRLSDYIAGKVPINEDDYSVQNVSKCRELINFYKEMEE